MKKERIPHNYKKTRIDIICDILVKVVLPCIVIGIMLLIKLTSKASGVYFPMEQNANNIFTETDKTNIYNSFNSDNYYIFVRLNHTGSNGRKYCDVLYFLKTDNVMLYAELNNNGHQFSIYKVGNADVKYRSILLQGSEISLQGSVGNNQFSYFQNNESNLYSSSVDYISNFKLYNNNTDNKQLVLKYGWDLPPDFMHDTSHATPPEQYEVPVYTTGHTPPTNVPPTYTINNYSWTTYIPPTIDTSNAETLLESIYDAIVYNGQYLKDNIHGELTNLVNNIGGFVEYIGDTIQYYGNLIISNIQNGITTFYNNINSAIVGIGNAVGYITQPLDMDNLTNAVNSTQIWGDVDTCTSYANDAFGIYGTVAEPNIFKIPLDLRSISLLNITQVYYIDLSWLDGAKSAIRAFMWCVVTFGLLYSVIVDIPNMIRSSK